MDDILKPTGFSFAQYGWSKAPDGDYGIWGDDGANDLESDNMHGEKVISGTIDYFTRDSSSTPKNTIESALDGKVAWYLSAIDFESDTGYIHYIWKYEHG